MNQTAPDNATLAASSLANATEAAPTATLHDNGTVAISSADSGNATANATTNAGIGIGEPNSYFSDSAQGAEFGWGGYFQALAAVFLLLALLYLLVHLLRRMSSKGNLRFLKRGSLQLEGQLALGPKRSVVVVRFLNKRLVLGVTDSQINLLESMEADNDEDTATFSQTLESAGDSDDNA